MIPGRSEQCSVQVVFSSNGVIINMNSARGEQLKNINPFKLKLQVSPSTIVVIGGAGAWSLVTEYSGLDDHEQMVLNRKTASFPQLKI